MTDHQKAIDELLLRLKTSPFVTSEGFVNGYRISAIITSLRKVGHTIKSAHFKKAIARSSYPMGNRYVKYTYIKGPKQPEETNETNATRKICPVQRHT